MARPDKAAAVAELTEKFSSSSGAVLTEYRGLTVKALKDLRRSLGDDATYAVSKNTLTTIAVAKGLRDFARVNPLLIIKGGVLDGKSMSADEFRQLADLESREVLLAKAAGAMQGVLQKAVSLVAAPLSQAARLLAALEKAATDDPALIAGAGTPAPSTDPEPETETEVAPAAEADTAAAAAPQAEDSAETTAATAADEN
jgi:large subunit ribosomal protein L10